MVTLCPVARPSGHASMSMSRGPTRPGTSQLKSTMAPPCVTLFTVPWKGVQPATAAETSLSLILCTLVSIFWVLTEHLPAARSVPEMKTRSSSPRASCLLLTSWPSTSQLKSTRTPALVRDTTTARKGPSPACRSSSRMRSPVPRWIRPGGFSVKARNCPRCSRAQKTPTRPPSVRRGCSSWPRSGSHRAGSSQLTSTSAPPPFAKTAQTRPTYRVRPVASTASALTRAVAPSMGSSSSGEGSSTPEAPPPPPPPPWPWSPPGGEACSFLPPVSKSSSAGSARRLLTVSLASS
mmetsp:Transcript_20772/g.52509  ORF Transcript_20772/g.52509 Transcript_20772/m.52509 type:complete len:293 (+) Transcript_20772:142-1020(+)